MNLQSIKKHTFAGAFAAIAFFSVTMFFGGCSSSTTPSDGATVTMRTELQNSTVSGTFLKSFGNTPSGGGVTCDSVVISRARILISAMKLHHNDNDSAGEGTIKAGPFVAEFNSTGATILSTVTIPVGTYDRIKFEMHKLDDKNDASLLNDPLFGDFVNGGRYTAIIDGNVYVGGVAYPFSFKTSRTDNTQVFFNPAVTFSASSSYDLRLAFDPILVFGQAGSRPFDPRSSANQNDIEKLIKDALKALKK